MLTEEIMFYVFFIIYEIRPWLGKEKTMKKLFEKNENKENIFKEEKRRELKKRN
jgi:hypothetical protein